MNTKNKNEKAKQAKQKKNFLDVTMKISRFPELRYRREFTEFILSQFVSEAATKCLEIKEKYKIIGKSLTPGKAVEICFGEKLYIDVEPENNRGYEKSWFGKTSAGEAVLWINPDSPLKEGQSIMLFGLADYLLNGNDDVLFTDKTYNSLEELCENPALLKAAFRTEALAGMLRSNESKSELVALQSVTKQGGNHSTEKETEVWDLTGDVEIPVAKNEKLGLLTSSLVSGFDKSLDRLTQSYTRLLSEIETNGLTKTTDFLDAVLPHLNPNQNYYNTDNLTVPLETEKTSL